MPTAPSVSSSHTVRAAAATSSAATATAAIATVGATPPSRDKVEALILLHGRQDQASKDRITSRGHVHWARLPEDVLHFLQLGPGADNPYVLDVVPKGKIF